MLRGDDIAELQHKLSALGFDPGRIDGIFGDQTAIALMDFQKNAGLPVDGICGRRTLVDLVRLRQRDGNGSLVSPLREHLQVLGERGATLRERRIGVGETGGFSSGAAAFGRALREAGAATIELHDPDPSRQAVQANAAKVDCFVSLLLAPERSSCTTVYYRGFRYESLASRHLAEIVQRDLPSALGLVDGGICGMALPILRETRMPAIEVQLGAPGLVVQRTAELAKTLFSALSTWIHSG